MPPMARLTVEFMINNPDTLLVCIRLSAGLSQKSEIRPDSSDPTNAGCVERKKRDLQIG